MRKSFFITLAIMILSLTSSTLFARGMGGGMGYGEYEGMGPGMGFHKPYQHLEKLQYRLDLTNAQVDKLYKIDKDYMDKFHQNRNDQSKIKELREKQFAEIESILTPEQKERWNGFGKNRRGKDNRKDSKNLSEFRHGYGMPGFGLGMLEKDLGLSNEQINKIYTIHRDYMDNFYQARNDGDKVRDLRTKQQVEIENVFTQEQKKKFNEFKKNPPRRGKFKRDEKEGRHGMWDDDDEE